MTDEGPTTDELQRDLDAAQAALERHLGELKQALGARVERATRIVRGPFAWLERHTLLAALGAFVLGAGLGLFKAERLRRRRPRLVLAVGTRTRR